MNNGEMQKEYNLTLESENNNSYMVNGQMPTLKSIKNENYSKNAVFTEMIIIIFKPKTRSLSSPHGSGV